MIPKPEAIIEVIQKNWDGFTLALEPVPTTIRLFRIKRDNERFMVRINFDRGKFKAPEMAEFVDYLHTSKCLVPSIVPTNHGTRSAPIEDMAISIESELPGVNSGPDRLDILPQVGKGLAQIHNASQRFKKSPEQRLPLSQYTEQKLRQALRKDLPDSEKDAINKLQNLLTQENQDKLKIPVCWLTTHGDVRGPNVLVDGNTIGFTDIYSPFAPALVDLVMIKDKWLLGGFGDKGRPLEMDEVAQVVKGYTSIRPFSAEDRETFAILWVAWAAPQLAHYASHKKVGGTTRHLWDFHNQVLNLPNLVQEIDHFISATL